MNADGSNPTRLTNNPAQDRSPSWSPDGTKIAFMSSLGIFDDAVEIYVMNTDGTNLANLTNNKFYDADPSWSPDGSRIVFVSVRDGLPKVHTMNPDGTGVVDLKAVSRFRQSRPIFSPDGRKILFVSSRDGNPEVYVMNKDGSDQRNLSQHVGNDWYAVWSPDGSKIAFLSDRNPPGIYLMRADGSDVRLLTKLSAEPHAWAAPSLIVGVEAKGKLAMTWGEVKKLEGKRSQR